MSEWTEDFKALTSLMRPKWKRTFMMHQMRFRVVGLARGTKPKRAANDN